MNQQFLKLCLMLNCYGRKIWEKNLNIGNGWISCQNVVNMLSKQRGCLQKIRCYIDVIILESDCIERKWWRIVWKSRMEAETFLFLCWVDALAQQSLWLRIYNYYRSQTLDKPPEFFEALENRSSSRFEYYSYYWAKAMVDNSVDWKVVWKGGSPPGTFSEPPEIA